MLYLIFILSSFALLATAVPTSYHDADLVSRRSPEDIQLKDGSFITISDISDPTEKRSPENVQLQDGTSITISDDVDDDSESLENRSPHLRRDNKITSCGPKEGWMPVADSFSSSTGTQYWGYQSTVEEFCSRVSYDVNGNPLILGPKKKASYTIRHQHDDDDTGYRVGLKGNVPGHIEFEIHNKSEDADYKVGHDECREYLLMMADANSDCYGKTNKDTKGGTYEAGKQTFHALPAAN